MEQAKALTSEEESHVITIAAPPRSGRRTSGRGHFTKGIKECWYFQSGRYEAGTDRKLYILFSICAHHPNDPTGSLLA